MDDNRVICGANAYEKKYFLNEPFNGLPQAIQDELHIICVLFTEEVGGIFAIGFDEDGELNDVVFGPFFICGSKEEDLISLENKIFDNSLSDEQIKQRIDMAYSIAKENYEKRNITRRKKADSIRNAG